MEYVKTLDIYKVSFHRILKLVEFAVEGCPAKGKNLVRLREHFILCRWKSKVTILQERP